MKYLLFSIVLVLSVSCKTKTPSNKEAKSTLNSTTPAVQSVLGATNNPTNTLDERAHSYKSLHEATGDLDGDGEMERAVVYDTGIPGGQGNLRELRIFKQGKNKLNVWHKFIGPIMSSGSGGKRVDPFRTIAISNGILSIKHTVEGDSVKNYMHQYRFRNDEWDLIHLTSELTVPCKEVHRLDYDLVARNATFYLSDQKCKNSKPDSNIEKSKSSFNVNLSSRATMKNFQPANQQMKIPDSNFSILY